MDNAFGVLTSDEDEEDEKLRGRWQRRSRQECGHARHDALDFPTQKREVDARDNLQQGKKERDQSPRAKENVSQFHAGFLHRWEEAVRQRMCM